MLMPDTRHAKVSETDGIEHELIKLGIGTRALQQVIPSYESGKRYHIFSRHRWRIGRKRVIVEKRRTTAFLADAVPRREGNKSQGRMRLYSAGSCTAWPSWMRTPASQASSLARLDDLLDQRQARMDSRRIVLLASPALIYHFGIV